MLSTIDQNDHRRCRYHHDYSSYLSRTTDGNTDSCIYASFLLLLSRQAKRFALHKNAQSLKNIVFEYIIIINKGYGVRATTIEGPNAVKGLNSNAVLSHKFHLTDG